MKGKLKKILLTTCLMVPCALALTACGDKEMSSNGGKGAEICVNNSCQYTKCFNPTDFMDTPFYTWAAQKNFPKKGKMEYNAWVQQNFSHIREQRFYNADNNPNVFYNVYHAAVCETCGNIKAEKHTFEHVENLGGFDHNVRCTSCDYTHEGYCYFYENGELEKTEEDCFCGHEKPNYTAENDPQNPDGSVVTIAEGTTGDIVIPRMAKGKVVTTVRFSSFANLQINSISIPYTAINRLELSANTNIKKIIITGYTQAEAEEVDAKFFEIEDKYQKGEIDSATHYREINKLMNMVSPVSNSNAWMKVYGLTNLKSIEIAEGQYALASSNFIEIKDCTVLEKVETNSLRTTFLNCPALTSVSGGGIVFNDEDTSTLPAALTEVTITAMSSDSVINLPSTVKTVNMKNCVSIPSGFFTENSTIETINAEDVLTVGSEAFYGCTALKTVNLPDATEIDYRAFMNCTALETVNIPKVEEMGDRVFSGCTSLTSADIPKARVLDWGTFYGCTSLKNVTLCDDLEILGSDMFSDCTSLEEITIPKGVTEIGNSVFFNCINLKTIRYNAINASMGQYCIELFRQACTEVDGGAELIIGKDVEKLPEKLTVSSDGDSQYGAVNITKITFEDGGKLETIETGAISNLKITTITLPSSVTTVEDGAFSNNFFLETIVYGSLDLSAAVLSNCPAYEYEVEDGLKYFGKTLVGVESIVTSITPRAGTTRAVALEGVNFVPEAIKPYIESVVMPNSIIEWSVSLKGLTNLSSVTLSSGLTEISERMFENCHSLTSISIPNSVEKIGEEAFRNCSGLASVTIPGSVKELGPGAFYICINLTSVTLNEGLVTIGNGVFGLCKKLPGLTLPSTVRSIGRYAFDNAGFDLDNFTLTLNEGLTEIGEYAISQTHISTISIPSTVVSIGEGAFSGSELTSISIPEGVTVIEREAFKGCNFLATIFLPSTIKTIKENAFEYCVALEEITIPAAVEVIEDYAFANCDELATINLEGNVTLTTLATNNCPKYKGQLVDGLYYKGTTLSALADTTAAFVYIKEGTTEIASGVFTGLTTLRGVYIPESCTTIPTDTFSGCTNVTLLFAKRWTTGLTGIDYMNGRAIQNATVTKTGYLYSTSGNDAVIEGYYGGEKNVTIPEKIGGYTVTVVGFNNYGKGAFEGNTTVESVTMGSNVIDIYGNAFKNCTNLTTVTMTESICMFNMGAFAGCSSLTTVTVPGSDFGIYTEDAIPGLDAPIKTIAVNDANFITYLTTTYANYSWVRNLQFVG